MTTALLASIPDTAALATSATGIHMILGSASVASSSLMPAASPKPVRTRSRAEHGHRHSGRSQLAAQSVAVGQHKRLAGPIAGLPRQRLERSRRGHVEHHAAPSLDHAGQEERAQVDHRLHVRADHGDLPGRVRRMDRADGGHPGVVDQHVDRQRAGGELGGDGAAGLLVGQVGADDLGPDAVP